jgi:type II secretory pathway component GspD/PulD (secretin)
MVFRFKHTRADLISGELAKLQSSEGKIITDARTNTAIVIDVPQAIQRMRVIAEKMDVPVSTQTFLLTYTTPEVVQPPIQAILTPVGRFQTDTKSNKIIITDTRENLNKVAQLLEEYDCSPITITRVFTLRYAKQATVSPTVSAELTPGTGKLHEDGRNNSLIVTDLPENIAKIEKVIQALDKKPQEVLIEAKVLQVSLDDQTKLGVDWEAVSRGSRVKEIGEVEVKAIFDVLTPSDPGVRVVSGVLDKDGYTATLQALESVTEVNLLSSPRITALSNEEARILVGSTVPYKTVDTREEDGSIRTFEKVTMVDVGVKLFVTPTINEDGFVTMKIRPEVSSVTGYAEGIPVVEKSETETSVMVKDGVTIVIGGLIKDEHRKTIKRVPILGRIPLLGLAFRSTDDAVVKTELVIFITPHIITGDTDTEELIKLKSFQK